MSGTLAPLLLRIAAAVDGDGGAAVRGVLESVLQDRAPYEAGEIVYARSPGDHTSYLLGQAREAFLGRDLVEHVLAQGVPLRLDDLREAAPFPETHALLRRLGLRSILVLPFRFGEPDGPRVRGAVALARSHGWAFAGASLPLLVPLAGLAGLAFDHALRLSAPGGAGARPRGAPPAPPGPTRRSVPQEAPEPERAESETAAAELWSARAAAAAAREEADAARSLADGLRAELEAARPDAVRAAEALREALGGGARPAVECGRGGGGAPGSRALAGRMGTAGRHAPLAGRGAGGRDPEPEAGHGRGARVRGGRGGHGRGPGGDHPRARGRAAARHPRARPGPARGRRGAAGAVARALSAPAPTPPAAAAPEPGGGPPDSAGSSPEAPSNGLGSARRRSRKGRLG